MFFCSRSVFQPPYDWVYRTTMSGTDIIEKSNRTACCGDVAYRLFALREALRPMRQPKSWHIRPRPIGEPKLASRSQWHMEADQFQRWPTHTPEAAHQQRHHRGQLDRHRHAEPLPGLPSTAAAGIGNGPGRHRDHGPARSSPRRMPPGPPTVSGRRELGDHRAQFCPASDGQAINPYPRRIKPKHETASHSEAPGDYIPG